MSRNALLGLLLVALGVAVFVRWNSRSERADRGDLSEPAPASPEPDAPSLSAPVSPEDEAETRAPSPADPAMGEPALVGPLGVPLRVVDPGGQPLAGASVVLFADQEENTALHRGQTGADGTCHVPAPEGRWSFARIEHDGFGHAHVWLEDADPLEVELARVVRLTGSVRNAVSRTPVAGATVRWALPRAGGCQECEPEAAVSDEHGDYAIAELERSAEPVHFWVEAEGYPRHQDAFTTAGGALALAHDFELRPGRELTGIVVDHGTGLPLEGVYVSEAGGSTRSDAAGRFRLLAGGEGIRSTLYAELDGYCGLELPVALDAREPVPIALVRSASLTGRVRDPAGRPVAGAEIEASARPLDERTTIPTELDLPPEWRWYSRSDSREAESDADGAFTLTGLLPLQKRVFVSATCDGYRPANVRPPTGAPGETSPCELVLEPESSTGTIHGRLTLNGKPARATVHWKSPTRDGYAWALDGEYRLEHVEPGRVALSVRPDGSTALRAQLAGHEAEVEVTPGSDLEQDFALALAVAQISGSVRFEDGTPVKGHEILIRGPPRFELKITTGEDGLFACEVPLQGGPYELALRYSGETWRKSDVAAGANGVGFVLPSYAELRFRAVELGTGLAVQQPWVHWRREGEKDFHPLTELRSTPDASGWFHAAIPPGRIELLARSDRHHWVFAPGVVVTPGAMEHVFELEPGHALTFELDPASGAWPRDHALVVVEPEAAPSLAGQVYKDGQCRWTYGDRYAPFMLERRRLDFAANARVSLSGLVGRQLLLVFPDDLVLEPAELEVDGPRLDPIVVRWRRK